MRRDESKADWRAKLNPLFVLGVHFLQAMPRLLRDLLSSDSNPTRQSVVLEVCRHSMPLLPSSLVDASRTEQDITELAAKIDEIHGVLVDPVKRRAVVEVVVGLTNSPP